MSRHRKVHRAWLVFAGVCIFNLIGYGLIVNCFGTFLVPTSQGLGISITEVSITHSVRTICGTVGSLLAGQLMQRIDLKKYLAGICIAIAAAAFLTSCSTQLWQLLLSAALLGLSVGMGIYTLVPLVIPQWFKQPEGYIGFATACGGIGGILFAPLLTWLMGTQGWKMGYYLMVAVALLIMLPIAILLIRYSPRSLGLQPYDNGKRREKKPANSLDENDGATLQKAVRSPSFYLIILFFVSVALVSGVYTHMPNMLREEGFSDIQAGYLYSFYQMGAAGAQFLVGLLSIKLNIKRTIHLFMGLILVGVVGIGFINPGLTFTALFVLLVGSGRAVGVVAGPILVRNTFGQKHYNTIFSGLYTSYLGAVAVSTTLYGLIYDTGHSYHYAYFVIIGCCAITMLSTQFTKLRTIKKPPVQQAEITNPSASHEANLRENNAV